ncbi:MAG: PEP-CTERM sorting domain-containing protein [Cyanobacteria bacterium J06632_3]
MMKPARKRGHWATSITAGIAAVALGIPTLTAPAAMADVGTQDSRESQPHANQLYENQYSDWAVSVDAVGDSNDGLIYDIRAIAIKETAEKIYVSISANLPLSGVYSERAEDAEIGWGDLFFDFTGGSFNEANANSRLFAVKFADGTDSGVGAMGVYHDVSAKSVGAENDGFRTFQEYYDAGLERPNTFGSYLADRASAYSYYSGQTTTGDFPIFNVVDVGTRLGDVRILSEAEAVAQGVDFKAWDAEGDVSITFEFDRALLPAGSFVASLFIECANDGIAIVDELSKVIDESEPVIANASAGTGRATGGATRGVGGAIAGSLMPSALAPHMILGTSDETVGQTTDTDTVVDVIDSKTDTDGTDIDTVVDVSEETQKNKQSIPEPGSMAGFGVIGLFGIVAQRRAGGDDSRSYETGVR